MKKVLSVMIGIHLATSLAQADWADTAGSLWQDSKGVAGSVWEKTKGSVAPLVTKNEVAVEVEQSSDSHFDDIWNEVIKKLEEGLEISNEAKDAPAEAYFGADKKSLRKDFNEVLEDVVNLLLDKSLLEYRGKIEKINNKIASLQQEILSHREARVTAPVKSTLSTTKSGYDEKIEDIKVDIAQLEIELEAVKEDVSQNFNKIGVNLDTEQVDVLLVRIDGDDIIQMTLVMDVLKKITSQLMELMKESGEELAFAKKYYGMHMVLLKLVMYIQDKYIAKVDNNFIPKINQIISKTIAVKREAISSMKNDSNASRVSMYKSNIQAHDLTLKAAKLYLDNVKSQRNKVRKAYSVTQKDLSLAKNTYDTVVVSSDLFDMFTNSKNIFSAVMSMQVPAIIPFENLQMKEKYKELSLMIAG